MYAQYVYNAGASRQEMLDDLVAILTGELIPNNLSASCNKGSTMIVSGVPAGWTLHDAAAGSLTKVIKAPMVGDSTRFKYVAINVSDSGSNGVFTKLYGAWNETTHIGTNLAYGSDVTNNSQRHSTSVSGMFYIYSSARYLMLCSELSGNWGSPTNNGPSGCFERTRFCPFDTPDAGYTPVVFINLGNVAASPSGAAAYAPTLFDKNYGTYTGSSASLNVTAGLVGSPNLMFQAMNAADQLVPDAASGFTVPFFPLGLVNRTYLPVPFGEISSLCGVWAIPQGVSNRYVSIQKDGVDYMCVSVGATTDRNFVVRKE